jgi:hypothetical protein
MPRIIEVVVSPTGEATVPTKGYAGADCLQASKALAACCGTFVQGDEPAGADFLNQLLRGMPVDLAMPP